MTANARDLEKTIEAIDEAQVIVGHTLATIGFKGNAMRLVIEEVQFALRPAAVTLKHAGKNPLSNVVETHGNLLEDRRGRPSSQSEPVSVSEGGTTYRRSDFAPIRDDDSTQSLLLCLNGVDRADEFAFGGSVLTVYYGGEGKEGPRPNDAGNERLREAVGGFLKVCDGHLAKAAARPQQSGEATAPDDTELLLKDKIPKLASESYYLKLVLSELRDQILKQLKEVDEIHFGELSKNTFALQFFLLVDTPPDEGVPFPGKHLRYFPLDKESDALRATGELPTSGEKLANEAFIRQYPWRTGQSLIGYTFQAEASRFFTNWQKEPVASGKGLLGKEKEDRATATQIMQSNRDNTEHQFNIPLFAHGQIFGAIIINTPDEISWEAQRIPVRCARQVGSMIESALRMDPTVNETTRKIAAANAYKHMLSALLHEEGYYLDLLGHVYNSVYGGEGSPAQWRSRFQHVIEDRGQFVNEFNNPKIWRSGDPLRSVADQAIYHGLGEEYDTELEYLQQRSNELIELFDRDKLLEGKKEFCRIRVTAPLTQTIPQWKSTVLLRILANLLRNTIRHVKKEDENPYIAIEFGLEERKGCRQLRIIARDNCGGFASPDFPMDLIDFAVWDRFLPRLQGKQGELRGMGFLTLLKYAASTGGELRVENDKDAEGATGACVTLLLGLNDRGVSA